MLAKNKFLVLGEKVGREWTMVLGGIVCVCFYTVVWESSLMTQLTSSSSMTAHRTQGVRAESYLTASSRPNSLMMRITLLEQFCNCMSEGLLKAGPASHPGKVVRWPGRATCQHGFTHIAPSSCTSARALYKLIPSRTTLDLFCAPWWQWWPTLTKMGTSTYTSWAFWRNMAAEGSWLDSYTLPTPWQTSCLAQNLPAAASRTPPRVLPFGLLLLHSASSVWAWTSWEAKPSLKGLL